MEKRQIQCLYEGFRPDLRIEAYVQDSDCGSLRGWSETNRLRTPQSEEKVGQRSGTGPFQDNVPLKVPRRITIQECLKWYNQIGAIEQGSHTSAEV